MTRPRAGNILGPTRNVTYKKDEHREKLRDRTSNSPETYSDEQLMSRLAGGDMDALGLLYERHDGLAKAAVSRLAPEIPIAEIEELVQDVFLALSSTAKRFPQSAGLRPWLYGIAANKARLWRRKTWLRRRLLEQHHGVGVGLALRTNASPADRAEFRETISQALSSLPQSQREVLLLHAAEGFKGEEIARILGIRHKTVRTRLHRARKKLLSEMRACDVSETLKRERR